MRRRQSRDSCDSDAFARPRARRALTGLQGLDARPCPTPPGPSAGSVAGSCAALVTVCCGRKVALFTSLHGGHVVWSNCDFRVLSGPGELYYVPIVCTNTSRRPAELFPDLHESSRSDFGLSDLARALRWTAVTFSTQQHGMARSNDQLQPSFAGHRRVRRRTGAACRSCGYADRRRRRSGRRALPCSSTAAHPSTAVGQGIPSGGSGRRLTSQNQPTRKRF